jgi:excisionase family DNA binding protein
MQVPTKCKGCGVGTLRSGGYCQECEYMTQDEAAKRLHVSRATYFRMISAGQIHPRKIGPRKRLVNRIEIDNILSGATLFRKLTLS